MIQLKTQTDKVVFCKILTISFLGMPKNRIVTAERRSAVDKGVVSVGVWVCVGVCVYGCVCVKVCVLSESSHFQTTSYIRQAIVCC